MKLTTEVIELFERDQQEYGTKVALFNFAYLMATDILHGIGVKKVSTTMKRKAA